MSERGRGGGNMDGDAAPLYFAVLALISGAWSFPLVADGMAWLVRITYIGACDFWDDGI